MDSTGFRRITILRDGDAPVFLCSALLTHPRTETAAQHAEQELRNHNVGTILNVSSGETATARHLQMYRALNIHYEQIPIDDTLEEDVRPDFLPKVMERYREHLKWPAPRAFLVNCSAGINRSALAAGVILWETSKPRMWQTPSDMITFMRRKQLICRGIGGLLVNPVFERHLTAHCERKK